MNPLALARLGSNVGIVVVMAAFTTALFVESGKASNAWTWAIGGVALLGAAAQCIISVIWPSSVKTAWDEQVLMTQRSANAFGYFTVLVIFLIFLALVILDVLDATLAFYLLSIPLAVAPSIWMIAAHFQGRAG